MAPRHNATGVDSPARDVVSFLPRFFSVGAGIHCVIPAVCFFGVSVIRSRFSFLCVLSVCAIVFVGAGTSTAQVRFNDRIVTKPEARATFVVKGNVHPLARSRYDRGEVGHSFRLERITMMFKPTGAQQAALENLLKEQQDQVSLDYDKWLTPEELEG